MARQTDGRTMRPAVPSQSPWSRVWQAPLAVHAVVAAALLCLLAVWLGTGASFTTDEGASVLQAQALEHGRWTVPDPMPQLDPTGTHYPVELSAHGTNGFAPLGKHLFYGVLLAEVGRGLGVPGMLGLSIFGTVLAALLAAALAREIRPGLERVTFWFTALGTPLLFDSFLIVGHTLAAALAAASALLVLRYLRRGALTYLVGAAACCMAAGLVRSEAVLWSVGLATATILMPAPRPRRWRRPLLAAGSVAGAGLAARLTDSWLTQHALGAGSTVLAVPSGGHGPVQQVQALFISWLQGGSGAVTLAAVGMTALLVPLAFTARRMPAHRGSLISVMAVGTAVTALWVVRLIQADHDPVYGVAAACPVLWAALWMVDRSALENPAGRMCIVAPAAFSALVLATQYSVGGGAQWGGRYFALALPVFVPAAVEACRHAATRLAPLTAQAALVLAVAVSALTGLNSLQTLRAYHAAHGSFATSIAAAARLSPPGDGGQPVVVTSEPLVPRLTWPVFEQVRWQLVPASDLSTFAAQLRSAGVTRMVLVSDDPGPEVQNLSSSFRQLSVQHVPGAAAWRVVSMGAN